MDSVVNQTLEDIEIIPVDAGSTDGTREMLEEYARKDNRIRIIHSDRKSAGYQYNLGIAAAQGDYIGFVESDDYIVPSMYEILFRYAVEYAADWVKADYSYVMDYPRVGRQHIPINDEKFCPENAIFAPRKYPKQYLQEIFMWRGIYNTQFVRHHNIRLNETPGASFQDTGFVLQVFMYAERAMYIKDHLYCYRRDHQGSSSHQANTIRFEIDEVEYISRMIKNDPALWKSFWNINYLRALERFITAYERVPEISDCPDNVLEAVNRYRDYLLKGKKNNENFWEECEISKHFKEIIWLEEGIERFDSEYRILDSANELLLKEGILQVLRYKRVVIFGCGDNGSGMVSLLLRLNKNQIVCLSDNDASKWNRDYMGIHVVPPGELKIDENMVVLVANKKFFYEIRAQLMELGIPSDRIWICPQIMRFRGTNLLREGDILPVK